MNKKYVATIMNRLYLGDENYIFYVSHPEIGCYDEKTGIFTDRNGIEYASMTDEHLLFSEIDKAFANIEDINNVRKVFGEQMGKQLSTQDAISEYNYVCSRYIYYVSKTDDGTVFYIPIALDDMKDSISASLHQIAEMGGIENVANMLAEQETNQEGDYDFNPDKQVLSSEFRAELAAIVMEMMDGYYSLDELKLIKEQLEIQRDDIESTIDSVDLQIEASENGVSSNKLKDEEKNVKEKKVVKKEAEPKVIKIPEKDFINLDELYKNVTKTLIAQDEPAKRVITEIARKEQNPSSKNRALLITGPSGSGKTKMMELISKYLDRPFYKVDSTQLTVPGYVGRDIEEVLWDLYVSCGKDKEKCENAIIFFDEIDKKGSSKKDDVSGKGVLNVLLPFIEGSKYDATLDTKRACEIVKIDTSNMLVILGGAFTDVYKNLKENNAIGFGANVEKNNKTREAETEDFIEKAKMPDEFMGRVSVVKLNDLDVDAIRRIMLESDESAIKVQEQIFNDLGVKLTFGDDYIDEVAKRAIQRKTGARGLNTVVDETTWVAYGDVYMHRGEYDEVILGKDTVEDPKVYKKIKKERGI